jgi:hypothetical protein
VPREEPGRRPEDQGKIEEQEETHNSFKAPWPSWHLLWLCPGVSDNPSDCFNLRCDFCAAAAAAAVAAADLLAYFMALPWGP